MSMLPNDFPHPDLPSCEDDGALMMRICSGDASALARLYDRHGSLVFGLCLRALGDRSEAEGLTLDIFWEIWSAHDRYDASRANPLTYLLRVARSRIIDRMRLRRSRERQGPVAAPGGNGALMEDLRRGPLEAASLDEEQARVLRALDGLTPEQRAAIELSFFDALSHAEIAERLGEPLGTIKSRIRQALIRLRDFLTAVQV
jgi:RNA polymerase sigma-70 factor (ECF subfamily)